MSSGDRPLVRRLCDLIRRRGNGCASALGEDVDRRSYLSKLFRYRRLPELRLEISCLMTHRARDVRDDVSRRAPLSYCPRGSVR